MVFLQASCVRYLLLLLLLAGIPLVVFAFPVLFLTGDIIGVLAVLLFVVEYFFWTMPNDRLDIFIDDRSICGPVKDGMFALARPEAVPLSAVDLSRSRYRFLFGSYLALADGRRLIVSTMAHPTRNVRRVFEAVEARTREPYTAP